VDGRLGFCRHFPFRGELASCGPSYWPARRATAELVSALAGPAAEKRITGRWNHVGADGDRQNIADIAVSLGPDHDRVVAEHEEKAEALLTANWAGVERLAAALLASDTLRLTGRQAKAIVRG
jgi:hypothetical protein